MAPFDGPALATAKIRVKEVNAEGGVNGRMLRLDTCDTQNNNPARAKSCARKLLGNGADIIFTTCDVDFATPVVQEAINRGVLAISTCIGTDQMGPKRFGKTKGRLAFSFGNVAQDEGGRPCTRTTRSTDRGCMLVYFKNVVQAFDKRFTQLGGRIVARENYATGSQQRPDGGRRLNSQRADVYVTSTAFELRRSSRVPRRKSDADPQLLGGDGTYWATKSPQVTNYYAVTYASVFGDEPNPAVRKLAKTVKAATGGFVQGAGTIDGIVVAIKRAKGSTNGAALATQLEKFKKVPTLAGNVSFSKQLQRVRPPVPRHSHPEQQGQGRRLRHRQGRPEDLGLDRGDERPGGGEEARPRASSVSRSFEASAHCQTSRSSCTGTRSSA